MRWNKIAALVFALFFTYNAQANDEPNEEPNVCERLLDADLSGNYIVTNLTKKTYSLVNLRRMGNSPAYTVSGFKLVLSSTGARELDIERLPAGWQIGDEFHIDRHVNVMSVERDRQKVVFRFEDSSDPTNFYYLASPVEGRDAVIGDILKPLGLNIRFEHGIANSFLFTRFDLSRVLENTLSQTMKSLIAQRLQQNYEGPVDSIIVVELKQPSTPEEAAKILGTEYAAPIEDPLIAEIGQSLRFAVPLTLYQFLEHWPHWSRRWEISRVDTVPVGMLNLDFVRQLVNQSQNRAPSSQPIDSGMLSALENLSRAIAEPQPQPQPAAVDLDEEPDHVGPPSGRRPPRRPPP